MAYNYKTLIRNYLVDDATVKSLFNAAATGSTSVYMENQYRTGVYPQILIRYDGGMTVGGISGDKGVVTLTVECKGSGSETSYKQLGKFRSAILSTLDDKSLTGTAVCYLLKKSSENEGYNEEKKAHWLRMGFQGDFKQNFSIP